MSYSPNMTPKPLWLQALDNTAFCSVADFIISVSPFFPNNQYPTLKMKFQENETELKHCRSKCVPYSVDKLRKWERRQGGVTQSRLEEMQWSLKWLTSATELKIRTSSQIMEYKKTSWKMRCDVSKGSWQMSQSKEQSAKHHLPQTVYSHTDMLCSDFAPRTLIIIIYLQTGETSVRCQIPLLS